MRWLLLLLLLLALAACPKSEMMAPIPGASVEKWSATLDAVCADKTFEPRRETVRNAIAAYDMKYRCTPLEVLQHSEGDKPPFFFGGFLQFDKAGKVSRIELEMLTSEERAVDAVRRVLVRYGLDVELVTTRFRNVHRELRYEDIFEIDGLSISVLRHTGYTNVINISIQAP